MTSSLLTSILSLAGERLYLHASPERTTIADGGGLFLSLDGRGSTPPISINTEDLISLLEEAALPEVEFNIEHAMAAVRRRIADSSLYISCPIKLSPRRDAPCLRPLAEVEVGAVLAAQTDLERAAFDRVVLLANQEGVLTLKLVGQTCTTITHHALHNPEVHGGDAAALHKAEMDFKGFKTVLKLAALLPHKITLAICRDGPFFSLYFSGVTVTYRGGGEGLD